MRWAFRVARDTGNLIMWTVDLGVETSCVDCLEKRRQGFTGIGSFLNCKFPLVRV
jgi:hypothetical protein